MTLSAFFILATFVALMLLIGALDRRAKRPLTVEDAEAIGIFGRIAERVSRQEGNADLRKKMGITQTRN